MSNLLKTCLGDEYEKLAPLIQVSHLGRTRLEGHADIQRGNPLAQILCLLTGMPRSAKNARFVVEGDHLPEGMRWNRLINGKPMNSWFALDKGLLVEKLGFIHMSMKLRVEESALIYTIVKTKILGIPIPSFLAPRVEAREEQVGNDYVFQVAVSLPLVGLLIKYAGVLTLVRQDHQL